MSTENIGSAIHSGQDPSFVLRGVEPIHLSQGQLIRERADLDAIIEAPALPACQNLYEKNIKTISASANSKDTEIAYVDIDYPTLSEENKQRALQIGTPIVKEYMSGSEIIRKATEQDDEDSYIGVKLVALLDETDTQASVAARLFELSEKFVHQKLLWAPTFSIDQLKEMYGYNPEDVAQPEDFSGEGYYYDPQTRLFHVSRELFEKSESE